jgi:hypothetical protein
MSESAWMSPEALHRRNLREQRRCGWCAERVPVGVLLRGERCPSCGLAEAPQATASADLLGPLEARWKARRWWLYGVLAVATFLTGTLPLVATLLTVAFFVAMRFLIVREPLQWFGMGRRLTSRFTLQMWLLVISVGTLVANELLTFLPLANMPLKMLVSVGGAVCFVEGSLWFLRGRLRREASGDPSLEWWEWGLPVGLIAALLALGASAAAVSLSVWRLIEGLFA